MDGDFTQALSMLARLAGNMTPDPDEQRREASRQDFDRRRAQGATYKAQREETAGTRGQALIQARQQEMLERRQQYADYAATQQRKLEALEHQLTAAGTDFTAGSKTVTGNAGAARAVGKMTLDQAKAMMAVAGATAAVLRMWAAQNKDAFAQGRPPKPLVRSEGMPRKQGEQRPEDWLKKVPPEYQAKTWAELIKHTSAVTTQDQANGLIAEAEGLEKETEEHAAEAFGKAQAAALDTTGHAANSELARAAFVRQAAIGKQMQDLEKNTEAQRASILGPFQYGNKTGATRESDAEKVLRRQYAAQDIPVVGGTYTTSSGSGVAPSAEQGGEPQGEVFAKFDAFHKAHPQKQAPDEIRKSFRQYMINRNLRESAPKVPTVPGT